MNCGFSLTNLKIFARALYSLAKLPGEEIYFDAQEDGLNIRTVNSSRSAFSSFRFSPLFFLSYVVKNTSPDPKVPNSNLIDNVEDRTSENRCKIPTKSAVLIYKTVNNLEKSIETCELHIDLSNCRLVFTLHCKFAITRTYNFVLIECDTVDTAYDRRKCQVQLVMPATVILDAVQQNFKGGQEDVTFSVTEEELQVTNCLDEEPDPDRCVKTNLRLSSGEFDKFSVTTSTEITFSLKELRSFLSFIEMYRLPVSICFEESGKPLIFALETDPNFSTELILATYLIPQDKVIQNEPADPENTSNIIADHANLSALSQKSIRASKSRRYGDSQRVSDYSLQLKPPSYNKAPKKEHLETDKKSTMKQKDKKLKKNNDNSDKLLENKNTVTVVDVVMDEEEDVLPPSPPAKRPKGFLLIKGWSQSTFALENASQDSDRDGTVLAPDSDLEDH